MTEIRNPAINQTQVNPSTAEDPVTLGSFSELEEMKSSQISTVRRKSYKRYKVGIGISAACLVIFLVIGIAGPFIIQAIINSQIGKQTVLGKDNYGVWGQIPGDSNTDVVLQFTFFNFSNWEDFILHGEKPQFNEIEGYQVSQLQDYVDITWKDNDEVVGFNSWTRFKEKSNSRSLDQTVYIINPGPLGFWDALKNPEPQEILNTGLGITFLNTEDLIKNVVVGMTINSQFLPNFKTAWSYLFEPADIEYDNALFVWEDLSYGISQPSGLNAWILAAQKGPNSIEAQDLGNYFTLTSSELTSLILSFTQINQAANELVLSNYYCFDQNSCSGFDLTIKQIATMDVTYSPPPSKTILPSPSICDLNISCKNYYVEIAAYYQFDFLSKHTEEKYKNLTFSEDVVRSWFYHDGLNLNKNQSSIMHLGNLKALWLNGTQYDNNPSNEQSLENIRQRFNLPTKPHAFVFWNWIKYFYNEYINRGKQGGRSDYTGSALYGTQLLYKSWAKTLDRLHILLLKYKLKDTFSNTSCNNLFSQSMRVPNSTIDSLCDNYNIRSLQSIEKLILVCRYKYNDQWNFMQGLVNDDLAMEEFCDRSQQGGFSEAFEQAEIYLNTFYNCDQTPLQYCSDYELAAKQWASSNITLNPIPELSKDFKPSTTINTWFDDIKPFEYGHWMSKFSNTSIPSVNISTAYRLMNHDGLWSLNTWQEIWLETDPKELISRYGIEHQQIMGMYIRYVVVYVLFDGFAKPRKVRDLLFGYTDDLIEYIRLRNPLIGGDPSKPVTLHLNSLNLTREEAQNYPVEVHTGKNHPELTAYIKSMNGISTINFNTSEWNGNETINYVQSPWRQDVTIIGTDGKQSIPKQHEAPFNISIFAPTALRTITANYTGQSIKKFGFNLNKFQIDNSFFQSSSENPDNAKYQQSLPGFVNLSKLVSFPLYASKNHFYGLDQNWTNLVQFWNQNHTVKKQASKYDDTFFYIEPYSGVTFSSNVYLMLNYYYEPDVIFKTPGKRMLPIFTAFQSGNLTESGADKLLGSLKAGQGSKKIILGLGIGLAGLMLISLIAFIVMYKKKKLYDKKKESLIEVEEEDEIV